MILPIKVRAGPGDAAAALPSRRLTPPRGQMGRIRLRTLVLMRWIAVGGQTATVVIVDLVLDYDFPLAWALATIAASAALNLYLVWRHPVSKRCNDAEAALFLVYDTLQLAALLFLTGGLHNPFSFLLIAGAVIAATVLSARTTVLLTGLVVACASFLVFVHLPLPWPEGAAPAMGAADPPVPWLEGRLQSLDIIHLPILPAPDGRHPISHVYAFGTWISLVVGMVFFAANVVRVGAEGRRISDALMETQMTLAREHRLSAVGGLAAAAAHELGTPLGTIAVVAKELSRDVPADSPHADDVKLLVSQSQRCRDILAKLTQHPADGGGPSFHLLPFMTMVEMAAAAARHGHLEVRVEHDPALAGDDDQGRDTGEHRAVPQPVVPHSLEIIHGLENLIENAVDFARARIWVKVGWSEWKVVVEITDDGPGFAHDILGALGEPYVSTRQDAGGMGLGVFIAKTLLERSGGEIEFGNRRGGGARIVVVWPRTAFAEELWIADQAPSTPGGETSRP